MDEEQRFVVLAADDEMELLDTLELFFERERIVMVKAADGKAALELFRQTRPDLVLLDIMMPEMDGFAVLAKIRESSRIPAIMMTARDEDYHKILGLEMGADDYITKPYNPMEVVARVKAHLRRSYDYAGQMEPKAQILSSFGLELNLAECSLRKDGEEIPVTKTEYKILELLMKNPGRIFTKQQIFDYAWDEPYLGDDSTIMVHISNLRNKIEENPKKPIKVKTIKGLGYKFEREERENRENQI